MFYRRKYYIVKNEFVEILNQHFNETNLPNQLKNGAKLVGRWMKDLDYGTHEIFAIWEYESEEEYRKIETAVRSNAAHKKKIEEWYEKHGGRRGVFTNKILCVKNEPLKSTVL